MEKKKYHIVSFSGGKDSTAMLLRMIEEGMPIDEIVCCDTTVEFPAMYEHIKEVEAYIGRPITILRAEYDFEHYMLKHIKTRGKNKGKAGMGWPDFRVRWCTGQLKKDVIKKHLTKYKKDYEIVEYHGIAIDERENRKEQRWAKYKIPVNRLGNDGRTVFAILL